MATATQSATVTQRVNGNTIVSIELLGAGHVATTDGTWFDIHGLREYAIEASGITTGTIQLYGSNATTRPVDGTDGVQLGSNITANGLKQFTTPLRWIKAKVSAWTAGTIKATLQGNYGT